MDIHTYNELRKVVDNAWSRRATASQSRKQIADEVERMLAEYERQMNLPWAP